MVASQLDAGEFAAALKTAAAAPVQERSVLLQSIADRQLAVGARQAAAQTLAQIPDSRARYDALRNLEQSASSPIAENGRPGGAQADFDSLIELITTTVAPTTWDEVGGPGSVKEFATGVYVDAKGVLKPLIKNTTNGRLSDVRLAAHEVRQSKLAQQASELRKVSLPRLERQIQARLAQGLPPSEEMAVLAGLEKIEFVLVYPESGDLVLAGPAGPTVLNVEGRPVSAATGRPSLQLDDLVVILRHILGSPDARFGCSIAPNKEALARTQSFLNESSKTPLKQGQRAAWLKQLRQQLGQQKIDVFGIDPKTRVARVLVEADYHMKLIGMGLEPGTAGVESYLKMIELPPSESVPLEVLRWWFTMKYDAVHTSANRDAFELRGQGVQLLSENELLTKLGERVHTGQANALNQEFARNFTKQFAAIAVKYPLYAELQNLFDLALVCALIESEKLHDQAAWIPTTFAKDGDYLPKLGEAAEQVDTVINHRFVNQIQILVGVSGGVRADPWKFVADKQIKTDTYGKLKVERAAAGPKDLSADAWWWD